MESTPPTATLFDVQRQAQGEGPGLRTVLYFKGCALECPWCLNPEGIRPKPELAFDVEACQASAECHRVCPEEAIRPGDPPIIDWERCTVCGECVAVCPTHALHIIGQRYGVDELVALCLGDREEPQDASVSVTLSGGEPVLQSTFLRSFLPALKRHGVDVLLETAGHYTFRLLEPLLEFVDHVFFDVKLPDSAAYRRHTGRGGGLVFYNLQELLGRAIPVTVRTLLIPGINTDPKDVTMLCGALHILGVNELRLLKYDGDWESKLARLHTTRQSLGIDASGFDYHEVQRAFHQHGVRATW